MGLGGHLQAAQLLGPHLWQPGQHGQHLGAAQRLFTGPQALGGGVAAHPQKAAGIQPLRGQPRPKRQVRRADQHHRANSFCERRQQQAPLMLAGVGLQNFAQSAHRPAATRQLGVQGGMAGEHGGRCVVAQRVSAPDGVAKAF